MALQIENFLIKYLTNGAYFTYMQYVLQAAKADENVATNCAPAVKDFEQKLTVLDECMVRAQGSQLTPKIVQGDKDRDIAYRQFHDLTKQMLTFPNAAFQVAAAKIKRVLDTYKVDIHAQRDRETGMMTNLLQELEGSEKDNVALLGLTPVVEEMKRNNDLVFNLTAERAGEESKRVNGEVVAAREALDDAYEALRSKVNGYAAWFDDGKMDDFILYINNQIIRLKRTALKQTAKAPTATPSDPLGPEGEGGNEGGSGSEDDSMTGGNTGGGSGSTGGGSTPKMITVTYEFHNGTKEQRQYPYGTVIRPGDGQYPENTPGYIWSGFYHELTRDWTFTEYDENDMGI